MSAKTIILFMVDQLAARWVEQALAGTAPMPNLERLKRRGTTFTRAFTNNPVCCPARATIATGLSAHAHGVLECGYRLDPAIPTFMRALSGAGWSTAVVGKLHLLPQLESILHDYRAFGFETVVESEDTRAGNWIDWVKREHPNHYQAALASIWMTGVSGLSRYGAEGHDLAKEVERIRADFDWSAVDPEATANAYPLPFPGSLSQTEWITEQGLRILEQTPHGQDLFLQLSYVQPHNPFSPPAEYLDLVKREEIPQPIAAEWIGDPRAPSAFSRDPEVDQDVARALHARRLYFADMCHLDAQLGRVLDELENPHRAHGSYVLFVSDHGELLGDHGFYGKWGRHYDACIRIPLIIGGPGIPMASLRDDLVDLTDIAPTILEVAGVSMPALPSLQRARTDSNTIETTPGQSLLPIARGETRSRHSAVYVESNNPYWEVSLQSWARTIRTERHRLTVYGQASGQQLFDLEADPEEQHNLSGLPEASTVERQLTEELIQQLIAQDYPPTPRGLYQLTAW